MKQLRKAGLFVLILTVIFLTGCGASAPNAKEESKELRIVTTIFPLYDWTKELTQQSGTPTKIKLLLKNSTDLHSYQPTAADMIEIANCDMFIYVGGESEKWVDDVLKQTPNEKRIEINLMEVLQNRVQLEEYVEGMEKADHYHEHDEQEDHQHEDGDEDKHIHEDEEQYNQQKDEHIWLSLKNAMLACQEISDRLMQIDTENKSIYQQNYEKYTEKLKDLDMQYQKLVQQAEDKTLVFADRFPFRYLLEDYDLEYYAAFVGCSAETEASFETISFLAKKVDEHNLKAVLTIEGSNTKIAKTVTDNTTQKNQEILSLNSLQSVESSQIEQGMTYLSAMEQNLQILQKALQGA